MKNLLKALSLFVLTWMLYCSSSTGPDVFPGDTNGNVTSLKSGLYLLKNQRINADNLNEINLKKVELDSKPFISFDDIDFYEYSTHYIFLKDKLAETLAGNGYDPVYIKNRPFVFIAGNHRIYLGALFAHNSNYPYLDSNCEYVYISNDNSGSDDVRNDEKIKNALVNADKYESGLLLHLEAVDINPNSGHPVVTYKFKLTNGCSKPVLIPDPGRMGEYFHKINNGIELSSYGYGTDYTSAGVSQHIRSGDLIYWKPEWYTKLECGKENTYELIQKGYPNIQTGYYYSIFKFSGPVGLYENEKIIDGARVWTGSLISNKIKLYVSN